MKWSRSNVNFSTSAFTQLVHWHKRQSTKPGNQQTLSFFQQSRTFSMSTREFLQNNWWCFREEIAFIATKAMWGFWVETGKNLKKIFITLREIEKLKLLWKQKTISESGDLFAFFSILNTCTTSRFTLPRPLFVQSKLTFKDAKASRKIERDARWYFLEFQRRFERRFVKFEQLLTV